jgi:hypothetical protein
VFILAFSKTKGALHRYTVDVGGPGTPGSDEVLAAMNVASEYIHVGCGISLRDPNEGYQAVPRPDTAIEVVVLPGLAVIVEGLDEST